MNCDFMEPTNITGSVIRNLWKWPPSSKSDHQTIHKNLIIPIKSCLEVSKFSSWRMILFEMINSDIVTKFM